MNKDTKYLLAAIVFPTENYKCYKGTSRPLSKAYVEKFWGGVCNCSLVEMTDDYSANEKRLFGVEYYTKTTILMQL